MDFAITNQIAERKWPAKLGGDAIAKPRGVFCLGDCIDDGDMQKDGTNWSAEQYGYWLKEFGFDGTDGHVKYPVFEGWGNYDGPPTGREKNGFSFQAQLKKRNQLRKQRGLIANLSANGLHYSWDWDDVHFVQLNLYPADQQNPKVRYSPGCAGRERTDRSAGGPACEPAAAGPRVGGRPIG